MVQAPNVRRITTPWQVLRSSEHASMQTTHLSRRRHRNRFPMHAARRRSSERLAPLVTSGEDRASPRHEPRPGRTKSWRGQGRARDPARLGVQGQVRHIIMMIGAKVAFNGTLAREAARERDQSARLSQNSRNRFGRKANGTGNFRTATPPLKNSPRRARKRAQ